MEEESESKSIKGKSVKEDKHDSFGSEEPIEKVNSKLIHVETEKENLETKEHGELQEKKDDLHHKHHGSHEHHKSKTWQEKASYHIKGFLKNKYNLLFLIVLFLAFLIRLKYIGQESLWNDAAVHLWYSIKVTHEPLFMFNLSYLNGDYFIPQTVVAFFYLFTKDAFLAGKIVAMLYSIGGIILIYLLGTALRNRLTGLIAAALLGFNHLFWFYSVRPLVDSPLLVMTILMLYCIVMLEKHKTWRWGLFSGVTFLLLMFTKKQGILFVFALMIYYLLFKRKEMFKSLGYFYSWIIPVGAILSMHILGKILYGTWLKTVYYLFVDMRGLPYGFDALKSMGWLFSWYLIPFVVLGIVFVILGKNKKYYFLLVTFLFYWLFFEINVDNTQDRYVLPLLPLAIIFAVYALEEIGTFISLLSHKKIKPVLIIAAAIFICWNMYLIGDPLIYNKSFSYTGHAEAGKWMKENIPDGTPILAGSHRFTRLFTERDFGGPIGDEEGGSIWNLRSELRYADNQSAFAEDVAMLAKESDVYLEVDHIEYTQPSWYYPLSEDSVNYFTSLGFNLINVFEGTVMTNEGPQKRPMIFIFKKDKETT